MLLEAGQHLPSNASSHAAISLTDAGFQSISRLSPCAHRCKRDLEGEDCRHVIYLDVEASKMT